MRWKRFWRRWSRSNPVMKWCFLLSFDFVVELLRLLRCHRWRGELLALASIGRKVCQVEESSEKDEVASVHGDGKLDIGRWDVASSVRRLLKESVRPDIDRTSDDHLSKLEGSDHHRDETWWMEFESTKRVVSVHKGVNTVVHHNEPTGRGSVFGVREPRIHQHGDMVVPVQEDERLLT